MRDRTTHTLSQSIDPPVWLTDAQAMIFRELFSDAVQARMNLSTIDTHSLAVTAVCLDQYARTPTPRLARDLIALLREIGATPMARARLGVKPAETKRSKMSELLKLPKAG